MSACKVCRHCAPVNETDGFCHRGPPYFIHNDPKKPMATAWPPVSLEHGYCGEFKRAWWRSLKWFWQR